jgi:hypothetical protein
LTVPAGEVRLIRLFTAGIVPASHNGQLFAGQNVLDYHYQYDYSNVLRIKALSTDHNPVIINFSFTAYCTPGNTNPGDQVLFEWFLNDILVSGQNQSQVTLTAPLVGGQFVLKCKISCNGQTDEDTLQLSAVEHISAPPVVNGIQAASKYTVIGESNSFMALVVPAPGEILQYSWSSTEGVLGQPNGNSISWQAPANPAVGNITVQVTNQDLLSTTVSIGALAKDTSLSVQTPLIWYPFDNDNLNAISANFIATVTGATKTADARGMPSLAYRFTSGQNIIYTPNQPELNFGGAVSLSCWVKCEQLGSERFIISHGSYQQRYKLSITPEGKLRWTVKTSTGIADLDGSAPIELNRYYHATVLYTGYSMEMYVDGVLDSFKAFTGILQSSTKPITIGRMDNIETLYALLGNVDEVKLWDKEIPVKQIEQLKNQWATPAGIEEDQLFVSIYPNPAVNVINVEFSGNVQVGHISLYTQEGKELKDYTVKTDNSWLTIKIPQISPGLYLLRIALDDGRVLTRKIMIR